MKGKDSRSGGAEQTRAFEKGRAVSFYTRQLVKKMVHPGREDKPKIARRRR